MNGLEAAKPKLIESPLILVGEGVEEVLFFSAMLEHLCISGVQVEQYNGKDGLSAYLKTLKVRPGFSTVTRLGITRDADDNPIGALHSVQDAVQRTGFSSELLVRVFVLPWEGRKGALEDLCLQTIAGQPIDTCIEDYFVCVARTTSHSFSSGSSRAKARVHTWLAAQEEPDLRLGIAAQKGLVDWASPAFEQLKQFLWELYGPLPSPFPPHQSG